MQADLPIIPIPKWVISDTHFGHTNIVSYCPWRQTWAHSIDEHDSAIISAWKATVKDDDWVLHLGDVHLGVKEMLAHYRHSLPGKIIVIRGNHDRSRTALLSAGFNIVCSSARINHGPDHWICRHNPMSFTLDEAKSAKRLLHGHCHGNGYAADTPEIVREKGIDCSLDARESIGPVLFTSVC